MRYSNSLFFQVPSNENNITISSKFHFSQFFFIEKGIVYLNHYGFYFLCITVEGIKWNATGVIINGLKDFLTGGYC